MNAVDIAVVIVLLASGVFALMRGFVYEVLAMAGWIAAALAALWGLPLVRPLIHPYISKGWMADTAGGIAIFLIVLLISSFITHAIARQVRRSAISSVDRSLGFAFGLLRGLLLASLCFLVVTKLMAPDEPEILAQSKTRPLMKMGADAIQALLPPSFSTVEDKAKKAAQSIDEVKQGARIYELLNNPKPKSGDQQQTDKQGYSPSERSGMDRMIETQQGNQGR